jgi:hypothetical protein
LAGTPEEESVTSPLDDILKRLEHLERRMARLEAMTGVGRTHAESTTQMNAPAGTQPAAVGTTSEIRVGALVSPPAAATSAISDPAAKPAPPTLRLAPIPPKDTTVDFPDLSLLDEKVEGHKGPAQKLDIACAIEDYPRICTRIQQLWGTPECEAYLNTLVIDTRGNRKGFPPAMMEELLYLGRLARALVILNIGGNLWDAYDQVGDRR